MNRSKGRQIVVALLLMALAVGSASVLQAGKTSRKGYLGVSVERLSREDRREWGLSHGVMVNWVNEDSPAEEAGIEEDDVIQYFDGKKIRRPDDLVDAVRETEPKTTVKITIHRDGERKDLDVTVGRLRTRSIYAFGGRDGHRLITVGGGAYLGVELQELNDDLGGYFGVKEDGGALILSVEEDSPAEDAGLKAGDVIVQFDGEEVIDPRDVREIMSDFEEGDEVEIAVIRQKRQQRFMVELGEHPDLDGIRIFRGGDWDFDEDVDIHMDLPHLEDIRIHRWDDDLDWHNDVHQRIKERIESEIHEKIEKGLRKVHSAVKKIELNMI